MTVSEDEYSRDAESGASLSQNKADGLSPGEILREARLAHDYSVNDLCAQTKLAPKTIEALEDNDFQALSQPVFARGYYRQCAKVLDVDADRITRAYQAWAGEPAQVRMSQPAHINVIPQDVTPGGGGSRLGRLLVLVLMVIVLILVAVYFVPAKQDTTSNASSSVNSTVAIPNQGPSADNSTMSAPGSDNSQQAASGIAAGQTPAVVGGNNVNRTLGIKPPVHNQPGNAAANSPTTQATPSVPSNQLTLTFDKKSWVRVTDASGNRLASGVYDAGQTKTFNGQAPYEVRLGYAQGVKITIGGQPVDVAARSGGSQVVTLKVAAPSSSKAAPAAGGNDNP